LALQGRLQEHLLLRLHPSNPPSWHVWVLLLEDWCLAQCLLRRLDSVTTASAAPTALDGCGTFSLVLRAPEVVWRQALLPFLSPVKAIDTIDDEIDHRPSLHSSVHQATIRVADKMTREDPSGRPKVNSWRVELRVETIQESGDAAGLCFSCREGP